MSTIGETAQSTTTTGEAIMGEAFYKGRTIGHEMIDEMTVAQCRKMHETLADTELFAGQYWAGVRHVFSYWERKEAGF